MASVVKHRGKFYARFRVGKNPATGKPQWRKLATKATKRRDAQAIANELELQARRAEMGLAPMPLQKAAMSFGELYGWWWKEYGSKRRGSSKAIFDKFTRKHLMPTLGGLPIHAVNASQIEAVLQGLTGELEPQSLNHLRAAVRVVYSKATKRGLWFGTNPADAVDKRRVPKKVFDTLRAEEVPMVLEQLDDRWRPLFAAAVFTACRKGELLGLRREDVDLERGTVTVRRSYDSDTTKGGHADVLPIAAPLRPYLEQALAQSRSDYVFPREDGAMQAPEVALHKVLRRALARAGLVKGYKHVCRRTKPERCDFSESRADNLAKPCPKCGFRLWPKAIPRKMRFHDLRGSAGTMLARAGVPLVVAQRILRHSDPRLTANVYSRVDLGDMQKGVDAMGQDFELPALAVAGAQVHVPAVSPLTETGKNEARGAVDFSRATAGFQWSGRLDLNQRPLAPQAPKDCPPSFSPVGTASHPLGFSPVGRPSGDRGSGQSTPSEAVRVPTVSPRLKALGGLPAKLLNVSQVAELLGVCNATVYKLCERGELPHARVSNAVRVAPADLEAFVARGRR